MATELKRVVEAELLDELPPEDARAIRSRQDLRRVNFWMGSPVIAARALQANLSRAPGQIVELGAGDGDFLLQMLKKTGWAGADIILVDRRKIVSHQTMESFSSLGARMKVVEADVFDWLPAGDFGEIVVANLFLHHFDDDRLSWLLQQISGRAELFVAVEPRRLRFPFWCGPLLRLIGCNAVTRHDAMVSIRAGFRGGEISSLWPDRKNWRLAERRAGLFSHLFVARRMS